MLPAANLIGRLHVLVLLTIALMFCATGYTYDQLVIASCGTYHLTSETYISTINHKETVYEWKQHLQKL